MSRSVVLCGLGQVGCKVLESLLAVGCHVTVIDRTKSELNRQLSGVTVINGDCRRSEILENAGVQSADGVVIVTSEDLVNITTALLVRKLNPSCRIVVRMFNQSLISRLGPAVKNIIALSVSALTAPLMASMAVTGESLAVFQVGSTTHQLLRVKVVEGSLLIGRRLTDIATQYRLLVIGHSAPSSTPILIHELVGNKTLAAGDVLLVCGTQVALESVQADQGTMSGVILSSSLHRSFRTIRRVVDSIDLPVKIASLVLSLTILISVLVFRFGTGSSWAEGFFQTVRVAATGSDLNGENQQPWIKVYLGTLKLVGTALLASFTAILTNYLLKTRLLRILDERKIPDAGHVVVCGLGNVGFRCVQELTKLGVKVVVVEQSADCSFSSSVRRIGAVLLTGDATMPEVLRQARVDSARAVIAVTSIELTNLEIAVLVRELNPSSKVIVRITDPEFAQTARDAADIKYAISPPALAAPAFAAALLGENVQSLFSFGSRTLVVIELVAESGDPITGRTICELMVDFKFLPIGVSGKEPFSTAGIPKGYRLVEGDRLLVVQEQCELARTLMPLEPKEEWAVLINDFPLAAGGELTLLVRAVRGCSQEEASKLISSRAFCLIERVSRGRAEELITRLAREKVGARIVATKAEISGHPSSH